jgi:hypothetical protein
MCKVARRPADLAALRRGEHHRAGAAATLVAGDLGASGPGAAPGPSLTGGPPAHVETAWRLHGGGADGGWEGEMNLRR